MRIGAVAYQPYVYNTNTVSAASLGRISPLPKDGTKGGVDYSTLADDGRNMNPLGKGQSTSFTDIFASQMAKSRSRSMAVMKPAEADRRADASDTVSRQKEDSFAMNAERQADVVSAQPETGGANVSADARKDGQAISYRMRQALDAYSAAMGMVA